MRLLVGGYTANLGGHATGIGLLQAGLPDDPLAGGQLSRHADAVTLSGSPSWVARHPSLDVVYAALEGSGEVAAFRRTGEQTYAPLGMRRAVGELVCHVAVAPDGSALIASCWGDGKVVRFPLGPDGALRSGTAGDAATDPHADRSSGADASVTDGWLTPGGATGGDYAAALGALRAAAGSEYAHLLPDAPEAPTDAIPEASARTSRAHQATFLPGGLIATTDMGLDLVRFWRVAEGRLVDRGAVVLPFGSGPRHMRWHPSGHLYVVTELSLELFALAPDASGAWRIVAGTPLSPAVLPGDTAAELAVSRDGEFLYAGVRGSDTIAVVRVRGTGVDLLPVALAEAGVVWPRHHVVLRDTLLVAGQRSDEVASLSLDLRTGVPGRVRHRVDVPSPSCLVPLLP